MATKGFDSDDAMEDLNWLAEQPPRLLEPSDERLVLYYFRNRYEEGPFGGMIDAWDHTVGIVYEGDEVPKEVPVFPPKDVEMLRKMMYKFDEMRSCADEGCYAVRTYGAAQTFESESAMHEAITGRPLASPVDGKQDTYVDRLCAEIHTKAAKRDARPHRNKLWRYIERAETGK